VKPDTVITLELPGCRHFLLFTFSSVSILICERRDDATIKSAEDAIWWSISTITTVGYGDKYPVTTEGRVVGIVLMICGVGMFAGLSGLVASVFLGGQDRKPIGAEEILARLDQLQAKLDRLSHPERHPTLRTSWGQHNPETDVVVPVVPGCCCCGSLTGSSWRCRSSCSGCRRGSRGSSPLATTPKRCRTCRRHGRLRAGRVNATSACIRCCTRATIGALGEGTRPTSRKGSLTL